MANEKQSVGAELEALQLEETRERVNDLRARRESKRRRVAGRDNDIRRPPQAGGSTGRVLAQEGRQGGRDAVTRHRQLLCSRQTPTRPRPHHHHLPALLKGLGAAAARIEQARSHPRTEGRVQAAL